MVSDPVIPELGELVFQLISSRTDLITARVSYNQRGTRRPSKDFSFTHSAGDRTGELFAFNMDEDSVIAGLRITTAAGAKRGHTWVSARIRHRGDMIQRLARGYVYDGSAVNLGQDEDLLGGQGLKVDNEADSTLVNATALTRTITVPTHARWKLWYGSQLNGDDVIRDTLYDWDDGADLLGGWSSDFKPHALTAGKRMVLPHTQGNSANVVGMPGPFILTEGNRIRITWESGGASAGGTAKSSAVVEEWLEPS